MELILNYLKIQQLIWIKNKLKRVIAMIILTKTKIIYLHLKIIKIKIFQIFFKDKLKILQI
jgi:hypothetical protein